MCGIAAIFGRKQNPSVYESIVPMTQIIAHRGPDDEGYVLFSAKSRDCYVYGGKDTPPSVFQSPFSYCPKTKVLENHEVLGTLGHRRLSIVDLSPAGHQPMCTSDRTLWITYNGEVYNYIEIRKELEAFGYQFSTQSDTEVILQAYKQWGKNCLERFNGMFAFVLYDQEKQKVFVARDRFGVKPLYYWRSPSGYIAFASEIKQFTVLPGWYPSINGQRVYDFLNWGVIDHTQETLFHGVCQVRGGEFLEIDLMADLHSKPIHHQWYFLKETPFKGSFEEASCQYLSLFTDAVNLRLRADVEVGSCLSGGLDSSSIVCVANQLLRKQNAFEKQRTFSACSESKKFDERRFVDSVVNHIGVRAHYTYPTLDHLFEECSDIIWHQDEPFGSTSIYAQWMVFKLVKEQKVKVMLDGQGADEQLAGYHGFFGNRFYDLLKDLRWKTLLDDISATKSLHSGVEPLQLLGSKLIPHGIQQLLRKMMGKPSTKPEWMNANLLNAEDRYPFQGHLHKSCLQQSRLQLLHSNLPMLLHFEDRDSMAHSVESRTPFLDYRLVEFTLGLPVDYKLANGWTKRVLRESMKGILPEVIRNRMDKIAFATAEEEWIKKVDPNRFRRAIDESMEASRGIFSPAAKEMTEQMIDGKRPINQMLWRIISFGLWMKRFRL